MKISLRGRDLKLAIKALDHYAHAMQITEEADAAGAPANEYWKPEHLCASCGHPRIDHLTEADADWCTLPTGTCIFDPCVCTTFVEPKPGE
jgi:hypothetical protein